MMFEWARFKTYESAPGTLRAWRLKLAKAGFFYTGVGHKCKCAFCGFSYDVSSVTGDPDDVHRRLNPNCPFLVDRVNTNNIAIDADERALFQRRSPAFLIYSMEQIDSYVRLVIQGSPPNGERQIQNISEKKINKEKVLAIIQKQILKGTNKCRILKISKTKWYIRPLSVFFCGGGLRDWEPVDQPWIEHAHWYPECPFGRQCEGDDSDFKDIQRNRNLLIALTEQNNQNPDLTSDQINSTITNDGFSSHQAVTSVLELGFEKGLIKKAYDLLQLAGRRASIRSLKEENQNLRDQQTCKICLQEPVSIAFLPCGHLATCNNCAPMLRRCPICRTFIKGTIKTQCDASDEQLSQFTDLNREDKKFQGNANKLQDIGNVMDEFQLNDENNVKYVQIVQLSVKSDQQHMTLQITCWSLDDRK
ncbi:unnamed protein product [Mytilus edulis]|uniref:RING-type domain-containing protein n=1 Tax=Mytilus edulis TaxID=6550 RepID=A0A8S3ULL8_MYTED|nr:unnamed protein product [Mytilus edulis]